MRLHPNAPPSGGEVAREPPGLPRRITQLPDWARHGIRLDSSAKPELLEVRAGLLGRRLLLTPIGQIEEVVPEKKRIVLSGSSQLATND